MGRGVKPDKPPAVSSDDEDDCWFYFDASPCPACGGAGWLEAEDGTEIGCPVCGGDGIDPDSEDST